MPARSSGSPKVKRLTPEIGSVPTVATIMPTAAAAKPFSSEPSDKEAMMLRPSTPKAQ